MRSPKFYCLVLSVFLFAKCSKDSVPAPEDQTITEEPQPEPEPEPEPEPIVYFTFTVDESIDTSYHDNWILIHDENGKLLDYKAYETGDTLEFEEFEDNLTENIHVSLFNYGISYFLDENDQLQEGNGHNGITYPLIPLKSHWTQGEYQTVTDQNSPLTANGEFTVSLSNFTHYDKLHNSSSLGTKIGNLSTLGGLHLGGPSAYYGSTNTLEMDEITNYKENPDYLWTFLEQENYEFKYAFFEDPEDGFNVELDYNSFNTFSNTDYLPVLPDNLEYDFWQFGYETEANFKSNSGFLLLWLRLNPDLGGNGIPIATLDRFGYYKTLVGYRTEEYTYYLRQDGPNLSVGSFPEKPEIITNGDINSLEFSVNVDYIRREDSWTGTNTSVGNFNETGWKIVCDANSYPKISEFPEELTTSYPSIVPLDELQRSSTIIYLQGDTYRENLNRLFNPNFDHLIQYGFTNEHFNITE